MNGGHEMPFGAALLRAGGTRFRLWAPSQAKVELEVQDGKSTTRHAMHTAIDGWHERVLAEAAPGTLYKYVLGDGMAVPDPASRCNPGDIHGPSAVVDPWAYAWRDAAWRGRPWHEAVVYELHMGTFTSRGTFKACEERLPELAALGVTAIELLPLADFPGRRGWGYDGVLLFAPDASYGTPDELKHLIDSAHALGLMVMLDVVYNHFGPEGNYLHAYCPQFFNPKQQTPWGAAINFDGDSNRTVRDFYVHNALYWIEEYHFDGLRLDAVHAIRDGSAEHIACEIGRALRDGPGRTRQVHLVLENDANQSRHLNRDQKGEPLCATAQWNDDLHHAAHVLVTGETDGYYSDYSDAPLERFGRTLAEGFAYQGDPSALRGGELRGEPSAGLASGAFVSFLQNHDQIGNRAFGDRIHASADEARLNAAYACLLLSPHVPMFFMGEEFAASAPFLYFCDFGSELAQAVSTGRRAEFKRFAAFRDEAARERIPDPNAESTFLASKLRWEERNASPHRDRLALVRELVGARRQWLTPRLRSQRKGGSYRVDGDVLHVQWPLGDRDRWQLIANFGREAVQFALPHEGRAVYEQHVQFSAAKGSSFDPGAVRVWLETNVE